MYGAKIMKKRANSPHLLLIRSPFVAAGDLSPGWSQLQSTLCSSTQNVHIHDAAMDYTQKVMGLGGSRPITTSSDGTDPLSLLDRLNQLDAVLASASTGNRPCLFHRHGFAHPDLNHEADLAQFAEDVIANPFFQYAFALWQPFEKSNPPAWGLLYVETSGQMGPAVTLKKAWQKRWPQISFQMVGPDVDFEALRRFISNPSGQHASGEQIDVAGLKQIVANENGMLEVDRLDEHAPRPMIVDQMSDRVQTTLKMNRNFIVWKWHSGEMDAVTKELYLASRQGIWNHLIFDRKSPAGLIDFAAANANIVHSFGHCEDPISIFSDPVIRFPSNSPGYGRTKAMPGRPLWMALRSSTSIRDLLNRYAPKTLMRLRVRDGDRRLFEVGKRLSYAFKPPGELPDGYLDEIVRMVGAGGSVNTQFVKHNLERAYMIAYVEEEGVIVGNSSLKHPREEYIDAVSQQSGIDLHNFLERGYTSVRPEYRGLGVGVKLLEGLTERAGAYKIFSVIAESNIATQKMAIRNRTRKVATFYSQRANKEMSVWIPEWMLPEGFVLPEQPDPESNGGLGKDPS